MQSMQCAVCDMSAGRCSLAVLPVLWDVTLETEVKALILIISDHAGAGKRVGADMDCG